MTQDELVPTSVDNPYLDEFLKHMRRTEDGEDWCPWTPIDRTAHFTARDELVKRYAWAVPDTAALRAIAALNRPIVEIGAGLGYWASLLERLGVEIVAFDALPGKSVYVAGSPFTTVYPGDERVLAEVPRLNGWDERHALMLCWPPYDGPLAAECLRAFTGDTVIYIGEGPGGVTGDESFFEMLIGETSGAEGPETGDWIDGVEIVTEWEQAAEMEIPQWYGMHDWLWIYKRRAVKGT